MITVPETGCVKLSLYNIAGRVITDISQEFSPGSHSVSFLDLNEGIYFCAMRAWDFFATEKVVVLR